ncbi:radical SAM protein, partial [bacterium]|nr:radical SAM protein [bacterium]
MNGNIEEEPCWGVSEETLSIEVTTQCNGDCLHCFVHAGVSERSSLSVDVVKEIIAEGYNTGYRYLHITGGEPLLWEGLFVAMDYAFGMGYKKVYMNTNGTLITKDVNRRLAAYDNLSISVSLEGPEALHDHLRGKGSYRRTVPGIEKALNAGSDLIIFTIARKGLLSDLPHFVDELYRKFPTIKYVTLIQLIRVTGDGFPLSEELIEPADFLRLVQTVSLLNLYGLR